MKILIVASSFEPKMSPRSLRTTELVKGLVKEGHTVTLYISQIKGEKDVYRKDYPFRMSFYTEWPNNLIGRKGLFWRIMNRIAIQFFSYPDISVIRSLPKALKDEKCDYDMLISIVAPHAINWTLGRMYKKGLRLAKTWVADCGDPFMLEGNWHIYRPIWFKKWEKQWCSMCDYITVPHKGAIDGYYPEFFDKIRIIPQSIDFDKVVINEYHPNPIPTFVYSGSIVKNVCDPRNLLEYLATKDIPFLFHIYTNEPGRYDEYVDKLNNKLVIHPYKPRFELLRDLSTMDFLVNFKLNNTVQASSKIIDYALAKRPILYITYENMDTELVDEFLRGDYGRQYIVENPERYDTKNVVAQFVKLAKNKE